MRVGLSDPQGPRAFRLAPYALPALLFLFAISTPISTLTATIFVLASFAAFNIIGLFGPRRHRPRTAELECGPGYVDVKKSGSHSQRIRARDITGATTARTAAGILLTLQHEQRDQPITIEVAGDADASAVRQALGIGHHGFGRIAWRTQGDNTTRAAFVGRLLAAALALLTIGLSLVVSSEAGLVAGVFLGQFGVVGAVLGLIGLLARTPGPSVVMGPDGLRLRTLRGWFSLPYDAIQNLEDHPRGLVFSVPPPYMTVAVERSGPTMGGLSAHDRSVLVQQIQAAAQRARGLGPHKDDVTGRVEVLRRHGESPRDWLVRLDMAGQLLSAGKGYRGTAVDAEDLWAVLEDPEAEPDLRVAAARILRHAPTPNARVRIDAAVAAVRDEATNRRLRIAIQDDVDGASEELAFLDATEPRRERAASPARMADR